MSDTDSNPPRHNARWSDEQKRKVIALRRSGKTYDDIASTMGRTKLSVKSMCERLERAQYSDTEHSNKWNARLLKINAPLIQKQLPESFTHNALSVEQNHTKQSEEGTQQQHAHNNYNTDSEESEEDKNKNKKKEAQTEQPVQTEAPPPPPPPPPPQQDNSTNNYNYTDYTHNTHSIPFGVGYPQQTTDDLLYEEHDLFDETSTTYANNNALQYPLSINQITEAETSNNHVITTQQQIPWPANHDGDTQGNITLPNLSETHEQIQDNVNTVHVNEDKEQKETEHAHNADVHLDHQVAKTPSNTKEIEKQNSTMHPMECKDKIDDKAPQESKNESDNDCIIISVLDPKQHTVPSTNTARVSPSKKRETQSKQTDTTQQQRNGSKTSKGNQGSDAEYRRLIQKYGQSMRYDVGEIVTFFVPRLAAKGRFKDRIGKIECKLLDTDSKYQISDQQNHKQEVVPWKWILKAPPNISNKRKRKKDENEKKSIEVQQRKKHKPEPDRIPINSLKTREEKIAEFNRRMTNKRENYKQYSVPIHHSYYEDDYDTQRGRSLHPYNGNNHSHAMDRNNGYNRFDRHMSSSRHRHHISSPPPPRRHRYRDEYDRYHQDSARKKKQVRSYSVFPQRMPRRHKVHSPLPPLQHEEDKTHRNHKNKREREVINIADDEDEIEIKPEKHVQSVPETDTNRMTKYREYPRRRSRSRSPSHIRPSNRIIMNSTNSKKEHSVSAHTHRGGEYYRRYRGQSPPPRSINNGYYDEMDRGRYRDTSHYRYYNREREYHHHVSRSRSRERDRGSHHRHWREYGHAPSVSPYDRDYRYERHQRYDRDYREEREREYYPPMHRMQYEEDRYYKSERRDRRDRMGIQNKNSNSSMMDSWLQVSSRMHGGSKLGQREIDYLCQNDVYPEQIKQFMDSDKQIQEKYDMVVHYVDPTNGQNLTRSQVYSIIGAVITMKF